MKHTMMITALSAALMATTAAAKVRAISDGTCAGGSCVEEANGAAQDGWRAWSVRNDTDATESVTLDLGSGGYPVDAQVLNEDGQNIAGSTFDLDPGETVRVFIEDDGAGPGTVILRDGGGAQLDVKAANSADFNDFDRTFAQRVETEVDDLQVDLSGLEAGFEDFSAATAARFADIEQDIEGLRDADAAISALALLQQNPTADGLQISGGVAWAQSNGDGAPGGAVMVGGKVAPNFYVGAGAGVSGSAFTVGATGTLIVD